ncbi:MAG: hypothetical protein ACYS76_08930 [Planctomycetota bacterium]|jgi:hypothetical protein
MRIFNYKKPLFWIIASIISGCLAFICHISAWEMEVEQPWHYALRKYAGVYNILASGCGLFFIVAMVAGTIGIGKTILSWKSRKLAGTIQFLALILVGFFLLACYLVTNECYRMRRAISCNMLIQIKEVGKAVNQYAHQYDRMPEADWWSHSLINDPNIEIDEHEFNIGQYREIACTFAFNRNLDRLSLDRTKGNVVLLFEADGELDLSGGPELIHQERAKDKYFIFKRQKYIYILFVDGTIVKYRIHDGAVALYDPEKDEFTNYIEIGQTECSPLGWK